MSLAEDAAKNGNVQQWQNVLDKLVPEMESLDKDIARQWRNRAEVLLKPSLLLVAMVDGQEVSASVEGETTGHPLEWKNLEAGSVFKRKITYRQGNTTYVGNLEIKVDWKGQKHKKIELVKEDFQVIAILPGNVHLKLLKVEAGSFMRGSNDGAKDETPHRAHITRDFWLGETEVTQEQYQAIMGENPSSTHLHAEKKYAKLHLIFKELRKYPVENVTWLNAMKFCRMLTEHEQKTGRLPQGYEYTLPTEAQWEYAARGGNKSRGCKYSGSNNLDTVGWCYDNSGNKPHPVKCKEPNELGFYDMSGNVCEWCRDSCEYDSGVITNTYEIYDPFSDLGSQRVVRGGSWRDVPWGCRVTRRNSEDPVMWFDYQGFRVALVFTAKETRTYKVKEGDSLARIAYMFKVRIEELVSANNMGNNATLRVGSVLKLPENALETPRALPSQNIKKKQQPASESSIGRETIPPPSKSDFPENEHQKSEVVVYPQKVTSAKTNALLLTPNYVFPRLLADLAQYYSKQPVLLLAPTESGTFDLFYLPSGKTAQKVNVDDFMSIVEYINPKCIYVLGGDDFIPRKFIDIVRSKYSVTILQSDDWERNAANLAKMLKIAKLETSFKQYKQNLESVNGNK